MLTADQRSYNMAAWMVYINHFNTGILTSYHEIYGAYRPDKESQIHTSLTAW